MPTVRLAVRVEGVVQGVGFRPFVCSLARRLALGGRVANDSRGVLLEVEGEGDGVSSFLRALEREAPPLAVIERVTTRELAPCGETAFAIAPSHAGAERAALISPDVATCPDCLRELFDPADRRFRYPFVNCANCGPRFTIIEGVPYDRAATTMADFRMCPDCAREYEDPADRRFHAQPVACPACGPELLLLDAAGQRLNEDAIRGAARLLRTGHIVALKGLGGYHLAADAADDEVVAALRSRKHREEKAFAVMAPDVATARRLCELSPEEEGLLGGPRAPIVLLRRRPGSPVAAAVAPGNRFLGIMLPYTPVHHLLAREVGGPIVLTSGNVSDEPIAYLDEDARARLGAIADAFVTHDRAIHIRTDDSVVRLFRGAPMPIRRSRGYAPQPVSVPWGFARRVLACGAELKSTVCAGKDGHGFVSHHIGDLENYAAFRSFLEAIAHLQRLFDVKPEVVAHDLHPEYLSTKWALEQDDVELVAVQHHHAHIASCLVDNGERGPAIGVAFDGLGYGADGTLWGGEFLVADVTAFERAGHLAPVAMPGGVAAIREPWRMAAVYLDEAFGGAPALDVARRHEGQWGPILELARARTHAPLTSSAGRLFDAVSAVLGVRDRVSYEGQAAIELEQRADPSETGTYAVDLIGRGSLFEIRGAALVRAVARDLLDGVSVPVIAGRFHNGVADAIAAGCAAARERCGLAAVALSGGVFQNMLLL
ncbi:MAG TPA: carbamoyltransferase HypF, partial [Candidatus Methylomirabilis sp.]|nr:carbamoyltransferase HypF [Candidatus Methylomirabilis sp.]